MTTLVLFLVLLVAATDRDNITVNAVASPRLSASTSTSSVVPHSSPIAKWDEEKKIHVDYAVDADEELLDLIQMTGILDDPLSSWSASASALASFSSNGSAESKAAVLKAMQRDPIIEKYHPQPRWLWRQFAGTVISAAWPTAVINMIWATAFCFFIRYKTHGDFRVVQEVLETSATTIPLVARLTVIDKIWTTLMGLTTFLLTFFVTQAYGFWKDFYNVTRSIQGRLNTIQMLLASHATREVVKNTRRKNNNNNNNNNNKTGVATQHYHGYTKDSYEFLQLIARRLRLFHIMYWSSQTRRFEILLSDKGLNRLVDTGVLTREEKNALDALVDVPRTQKQYTVLQSTITACQKGIHHNNNKKNAIIGIDSKFLEQSLLSEFAQLRGKCGSIPDLIAGRMPLAYAHFVQILVDTFVLCTPIAK